MYTVPHPQQLSIFLISLGIGFLLGTFYDFLRALRLTITKSPKAHIIFDIIFFGITAVSSYVYILAANKGEIRGYILLGELIGFAFYYFSFGIAVIKITDKAVNLIRRFFGLVFRAVSFPFRLLRKLFSALKKKISDFFRKTEKKSSKMQKKVLQNARIYVYNLFGEFCAGKVFRRRGGKQNGKEKSKEKAR